MRHSKKQKAAFLRWQKRRIKNIMSDIENTSGEGLTNAAGLAPDLNGGNAFWKTTDADVESTDRKSVKSDKTDGGLSKPEDSMNKLTGNDFVGKVESITSGTSIVMKIKRDIPNALPKINDTTDVNASNKDCPPLHWISTKDEVLNDVEAPMDQAKDTSISGDVEMEDCEASVPHKVENDSIPNEFDVFGDSILDASFLNSVDDHLDKVEADATIPNKTDVGEASVSDEMETETCDLSLLGSFEVEARDLVLEQIEIKVCGDDSIKVQTISKKLCDDSNLEDVETETRVWSNVESNVSDDSDKVGSRDDAILNETEDCDDEEMEDKVLDDGESKEESILEEIETETRVETEASDDSTSGNVGSKDKIKETIPDPILGSDESKVDLVEAKTSICADSLLEPKDANLDEVEATDSKSSTTSNKANSKEQASDKQNLPVLDKIAKQYSLVLDKLEEQDHLILDELDEEDLHKDPLVLNDLDEKDVVLDPFGLDTLDDKDPFGLDNLDEDSENLDNKDNLEDNLEGKYKDNLEGKYKDNLEDKYKDDLNDEDSGSLDVKDNLEDKCNDNLEDKYKDNLDDKDLENLDDEDEPEDNVDDKDLESPDDKDNLEDKYKDTLKDKYKNNLRDKYKDNLDDEDLENLDDEGTNNLEDKCKDYLEDICKDNLEDKYKNNLQDKYKGNLDDKDFKNLDDEDKDDLEDKYKNNVQDKHKKNLEDKHKKNLEDKHKKNLQDKYKNNLEDKYKGNLNDKDLENLDDEDKCNLEDKCKDNLVAKYKDNLDDEDSENLNDEDKDNLEDKYKDNLDDEDSENLDDKDKDNLKDNLQDKPKNNLQDKYKDSLNDKDKNILDDKVLNNLDDEDLDNLDDKLLDNLDDKSDDDPLVLDNLGDKVLVEVAVDLERVVGKDDEILDDGEELLVSKEQETAEVSKVLGEEEMRVGKAVKRKASQKTMQASTSGLNPSPEDESDEVCSLDLHISESDAEDVCRTEEIPMEIEEEILNKFDAVGNPLDHDNLENDKTDKSAIAVSNNTPEDEDSKSNEDKESRKEETESEDLLLVMDEKAAFADETEFIDDPEDDKTSDEPSASIDNTSPVDSNAANDTTALEKDSEETDASTPDESEIALEESQRESNNEEEEGNDLPNDDFDAMEIEENEIQVSNGLDASPPATEDKEDEGKERDAVKEDRSIENALDENKENVTEGDQNFSSVLKTLLTSGAKHLKGQKSVEGEKVSKSTKRQLIDQLEEETAKRQKLISETPPPAPSITKLGSFKEFMLDKTLKGLTRDQLEVLCIQKMCESIRQKSEIGELKVQIKSQQQILESLRKEAVAIGKQTRDLGIVFDKINQDVANWAEKPDRPLTVPKITRSVGLQAVVKDDIRRKSKGPTSPIVLNKPKSPRIAPANNSPSFNQPPTPKYVGVQKNVIAKKVKVPVQNRTSPVKKSDNKGVIDLTDDDDKKAPAPKAQNGTKVNMINAPNGHKYVVMPNGQTVMVKLASPNIVVTQSIRSVVPVKGRSNYPPQNTYSPSNTRQLAPKIVKHPAPLPSTPPSNVELSKPAPPPKPQLMLNKTACGTGIILSWKMPYNLDLFEQIASYQLFAYQETKSDPKTDTWGKIGDVKALELPMAVTLTQFAVGNRYYFAVRAVDVLKRYGPFSEYQTILL